MIFVYFEKKFIFYFYSRKILIKEKFGFCLKCYKRNAECKILKE